MSNCAGAGGDAAGAVDADCGGEGAVGTASGVIAGAAAG
jgi:hypothetical protein